MKYGFSTLGCPAWSFDTILERARAYGFHGFAVRGIRGEMNLLEVPEFRPQRRAETLHKLADAGVEITMLMTGCRFASAGPADRLGNVEEAKANMDLAAALGVGAIRVFGGAIPDGVAPADARTWVAESLRKVAIYGARVGVHPAIEVHDGFVDTAVVRDLLAAVDHPFMKVVWDIHHAYRLAGQDPATCWENVGAHVIDTHFKDSRPNPAREQGFAYCLSGDGDVPNRDALRVLIDGGYDGYLTFEWEKVWHDDLPDASVAFPRYVQTMDAYLGELGAASARRG